MPPAEHGAEGGLAGLSPLSAPVPRALLCPITGELLREPALASDGHVYERRAIEAWLRKGCRASPVTGATLAYDALLPVKPLRRAVEEYLEERPELASYASDTVSAEEAVQCFEQDLRHAQSVQDQLWEEVLEVAESLHQADVSSRDELRASARAAAQQLRQLAARRRQPMVAAAARAAAGAEAVAAGGLREATTASASSVAEAVAGSSSGSSRHDARGRLGTLGDLVGGVHAPAPSVSGSPAAASWTCVSTFTGHVGGVWGLAHVKEGVIASGDDGGFLRLWDLPGKKEAAAFASGGGWLNCLDVLEEDTIVTGSQDGVIRLWDIELSQKVTSLNACRGEILSIRAVGNDLVVSGSKIGVAKLWDTRTPSSAITLQSTGGAIYGFAALGPERVVQGSGDGVLRLWDVRKAQQQELVTFDGGGGPIWSIASVGAGGASFLSGFESGAIRLWDATSDEAPRAVSTITGASSGGCALCLASLSPSRLASGHMGDSRLRVWDSAEDRCVAELRGHGGAIRALAVLPGGGLGSGSQDGTVKIWDPV